MNHTGITSNGPNCFGTTKRTSFVDIRDDDIPGPGTHNPNRFDKNVPSKWKFGKSTERDSFLEKYPRPNPPPNQYSTNKEATINNHPNYSIPKSEFENPAEYKEDDGSIGNYQPNPNFPKTTAPHYSFGYFQQMDYSTKVPAPNTYRTDKSSVQAKSEFNQTQNNFTTAERPLPYGQQGKNPGVGEYVVSKDPMNRTGPVFGNSNRPNIVLGQDAPGKYYEIEKNIHQPGKGFTMRPMYEGVKNKDFEQFPAANHYNPRQISSKQQVKLDLQSERSQLYNKDHIKYPSPQKHVTSSDFYKKKKSLSFTKEARYTPKPNLNPGPGTHEVEAPLGTVRGYMGRKLRKLSQFIPPGADHYIPNYSFTKHTPQRTINYQTNRSNFSKSVTGNVGPGVYEVRKEEKIELGKMSRSEKYAKSKNKNPGPGNYEIPSSIGKLPKYYCGKKKMTVNGLSTYAIEMGEKVKLREEKMREERRKQEEEEERMLKDDEEENVQN